MNSNGNAGCAFASSAPRTNPPAACERCGCEPQRSIVGSSRPAPPCRVGPGVSLPSRSVVRFQPSLAFFIACSALISPAMKRDASTSSAL